MTSSLRNHGSEVPRAPAPHGFIHRWGPAITWSLAIWIFSTHFFAADQTSLWIMPWLERLFPNASMANLRVYHYYVRKAAHALEYGVLSYLVLHGMRGGRPGWHWKWAAASLTIATCYAALDEVHQLFVFSRGASPRDVLLDAVGAALGLAFAWIWWARRARKAVSQG